MPKNKKEESKEKKNEFDLRKPVLDIDGNVEMQRGEFMFFHFDKPQEVEFTQNGAKKTETISAGAKKTKALTFRNLFGNALRGGEQKQLPISAERRSDLLLKCVADKAALTSEDMGDITKCVRESNDALHLLRTQQFFGDK